MGIFFNSYNKPGKGIDPDAPQKRSFFRFFDIFFRKFWHFGKTNLLYTLALIPTFIILVMLMIFPASTVMGEADQGAELFIVAIILVNLYISMWGAGPATAGMTYIMRNFAREEHAWLWSDFKDSFKTNFKQSLAVFVIDIIAAALFYIAIVVYSQMPGLLGALKYAIYMIIFVYTMMHFYIYPMMVTFELSLKDLYKNALLFALCKLPVNILVIVILLFIQVGLPVLAILYGGTYYMLLLFLILMLEMVVTQAFSAFLVNFSVYPAIKKYMLDVMEKKTNPEDKPGENSEDKGDI